MTTGVTQLNLDVVGHTSAAVPRFTQIVPLVVGGPVNPLRFFSRVETDVLGTQPAPVRNFTQINFSVLATRTPIYRFTNVILPDVFPYDISYNSVGSTRFATDVIVVDSGDDQRTQRWAQPLMEYDIAYGVRTMEQLQALIAVFRAMRGRLFAFNYRDVVDHTSSVAVVTEARAAPPITSRDQIIGTGDGLTYIFQVMKTYTTPSGQANQSRPITRPEAGTVRVAINSNEVSSWSVDTTTGLVTMQSPVTLTLGHSVTKSARGALSVATITGNPGDFSAFAPYVGTGRGVITSGFSNSANNVPISQNAPLMGVSGDGGVISVQYPGNYGLNAEVKTGASISIHPAPAPGDVVSAGFAFFVPVRFDTDTLPVQLEDYGIGSSNSVKLIEVRPSAW